MGASQNLGVSLVGPHIKDSSLSGATLGPLLNEPTIWFGV